MGGRNGEVAGYTAEPVGDGKIEPHGNDALWTEG